MKCRELRKCAVVTIAAVCSWGGVFAAPTPTDDGWEEDVLSAGKTYHVRAFTKTGVAIRWEVPDGVTSIDYLVVGGGGGGGYGYGGGGGGGGVLFGENADVSGVADITVEVGQGGAAGDSSSGGNGYPSSITITEKATVPGGGGGGKYNVVGSDGAAGGGGSIISKAGGKGTYDGKYAGGQGHAYSGTGAGGGGGGANGPGAKGVANTGGDGGSGKPCPITGDTVEYGGGGGGGVVIGKAGGTGHGGGGNGGSAVDGDAAAQPGEDGKGGGGGGGANGANGAKGGDGIVIIRYEIQSQKKFVDIPEIESRPYTGALQKAPIEDTDDYTVSGNDGWTVVGTYSVTVTLRDTAKACWMDGSDGPKEVEFKIIKADVDLSGVMFEDQAFDYDGAEHELVISGELPSVVTVSYEDNKRTALGSQTATARFVLTDSDNYNLPEPKTAVLTIKPVGTGDPDKQDVTYTWNGSAMGLWPDVGNWTGSEGATYGYPNSAFARAVFPSNETPVKATSSIAQTAAGIVVDSADVTLEGGTHTLGTAIVSPVELKGAGPVFTLRGEGSRLTVAAGHWNVADNSIVRILDGATMEFPADEDNANPSTFMIGHVSSCLTGENLTVAATNATINGTIRNQGKNGVRFLACNSTYKGAVYPGASDAQKSNRWEFSGKDMVVDAHAWNIGGTGTEVVIGGGATVKRFTTTGNKPVFGPGARLAFEDDVTVCAFLCYPTADNAQLFFGDGTTMTNGTGLANLGFGQYTPRDTTGARTTISNAIIKAGNQVYMNKTTLGVDCAVEFKGDHPRVTVDNTDVYIGAETLAEGEVLPSWRFVLPERPYEVAPVVVNAASAKLRFYSNTPVEIDLSAVKVRGRYPLFTFKEAPSVDLAAMTAAMSAYKVRLTTRKDAKERVSLGWDDETKTIYADVSGTPGLILLLK